MFSQTRLDPGEVVLVGKSQLGGGHHFDPCLTFVCLCVLGCGHWSLVVDHGLLLDVSLVVDQRLEADLKNTNFVM